MSFKLTKKIKYLFALVGIIVPLFFRDEIINSVTYMVFNNIIRYPTRFEFLNLFLIFFLSIIVTTVAHELLHGVAFKLFGGRVKYGFKAGCAYTQEITGMELNRTQFLIVLLTPMVVISLISIMLPFWIANYVYVFNFAGSVGDVFMSLYLCKFESNRKFVDNSYGFDIN